MRIVSPAGEIGEIPVEQVENALAAGARVMTDADMATLFNRSELERRFFEKKWKESHKPLRLPRGYGKW